MSSDESTSSDQEDMDAEELMPENHIANFHEGDSESTSRALMPSNTEELTPLQDLSGGQFGQVALTGAGGTVSTSPKYTVKGGNFHSPNLGPVTQHNNVTQKSTVNQIKSVVNNSYYGSHRPDEPSTSQDTGTVMLSSSIKMFTDQKLHKTKLIYKGEKSRAGPTIPVAVKLINHSSEALREAKSLHRIDSHPNVVKIYDSGTDDTKIKYIFLVMELCSKKNLFNYVRESQNFDLQLALKHSTQIISGLEYIHSKKILHRDLKPDNILFSPDGYDQVKIADFGMSKTYESDPLSSSQVFVTYGYAAPEIIKHEKPADPTKCDIFSLGILLVFILSNGKHPYGDQHWKWNYKIASGLEPDLTKILLPDGIQKNSIISLIKKMLQHNPADRPTAADVLKMWQRDYEDLIEVRLPESAEITSTSQGSKVMTRNDLVFETQIKEVAGDAEAAVLGPEENKRPRIDNSKSSYVPCIIGVTIERYVRCDELISWRTIEDLQSGPKIISEMGEVPSFYYSIVGCTPLLYLLMPDKSCFEFDLTDRGRGLRKLNSMKHDHGLAPPATFLNGKLYACGKVIRREDIPSKKCEVFQMGEWCDVSDMNEARNGSCVVSFKGCLYSIGGADGEWNSLRSVEKYDPSKDEWEFVEPLTVPRYNARAVAYNGKMCVLGGYGTDREWIHSFEYFEPSTSTWTLCTSAWWKNYKPNFPVVFGNKVFTLLLTNTFGSHTIAQVPLANEEEEDLLTVELPERFKVHKLLSLE